MSSRSKSDAIVIAQNCHVCYSKKELFSDVSLCLSSKKVALVGANGSGKTTLAKLMMGALTPQKGHVEWLGQVAICEQLESFCATQTVAQALGVFDILDAQMSLQQGHYSTERLEIASRDWDLLDDLMVDFKYWRLPEDILYQTMGTLSGGERTKVKLIQLQRMEADLLILDEPTNHLDKVCKQLFIQWFQQLKKGILLITHDRELLEQVEGIYELCNAKLEYYGGNYTFYHAQKEALDAARRAQLHANQQTLNQLKNQYQRNKEHIDQSKKIGKQRKRNEIVARGQASKMYYNDCRNQGEKTFKRISSQAFKKQLRIETQMKELMQDIPIFEQMDTKLSKVWIPPSKRMLHLHNLTFGFKNNALTKPVSWTGMGPFRISIEGPNGAGKTTLLKVILGKLKPLSGEVMVGAQRISYLSQETLNLNLSQTVFECFIEHNPQMNHQMAHNQLSRFLFKDKKDELISQLSGGELMRLKLACTLLSYEPPQLLILDEPTNHMDMQSIACVEKVLNTFEGALIVVSHDNVFLNQLNITKSIKLAKSRDH